ncbi:hypothetical protein An11g10980 [Aspergillus niger]|uniref:Uncharacterized protein n=2 Tax=Aspergillus niger TaxID=5061 RepID=A2QY16_ASPNC|nr:hypothetical protein An11g10980 [Aspergillus niger]CAK40896.1 hypothetical protein An11g10980 [Aspergillus niger]
MARTLWIVEAINRSDGAHVTDQREVGLGSGTEGGQRKKRSRIRHYEVCIDAPAVDLTEIKRVDMKRSKTRKSARAWTARKEGRKPNRHHGGEEGRQCRAESAKERGRSGWDPTASDSRNTLSIVRPGYFDALLSWCTTVPKPGAPGSLLGLGKLAGGTPPRHSSYLAGWGEGNTIADVMGHPWIDEQVRRRCQKIEKKRERERKKKKKKKKRKQ